MIDLFSILKLHFNALFNIPHNLYLLTTESNHLQTTVEDSQRKEESELMTCVESSSGNRTWPKEEHGGKLFENTVLLRPYPGIPTKSIPITELLAPALLSRYDDETLLSYTI